MSLMWDIDCDHVGPVHVHPRDDVIAHDLKESCVCGPTVDRTYHPSGPLVVHHALDGRKASEPTVDLRPWTELDGPCPECNAGPTEGRTATVKGITHVIPDTWLAGVTRIYTTEQAIAHWDRQCEMARLADVVRNEP